MTTATASGRIRRSVRFAKLEDQAAAGRNTSLRRERITVAEKLEIPSYQNTQDWTGGMGMSPSGRFRVVEEPRKRQGILSRDGIRKDWAKILIWALAVIFSVVLLAEFASIGASSLRIRKLETRTEAAQNRGRQLQRELADQSGDISVLTRAVELNLISSGGASTILLTAPQGATMTLVETQSAQATEEPEIRAAITGTE